jgi:hypothetical protein
MVSPDTLVSLLGTRGALSASRVKDLRTSLKKLADACQIPLERLDLRAVSATYQDALDAYFAQLVPPASAFTQRNTFQNLAQLYRLASEHGLLPSDRRRTPTTRLGLRQARQEVIATSPYRSHYHQPRYGVPKARWPEAIRHGWEKYCEDRALAIVEKTRLGYEGWFACYVGYNLTVSQPPIATWDQVFEADRVKQFMVWHAKRVGGKDARASRLGRHVLDLLVTMAEQLERPELLQLRKHKKLPRPNPMHQIKRPEHTFTLSELDAVGLALLEAAKEPLVVPSSPGITSPGLGRALRFQTGLLVRMWIRIPMRSRSIREMDLNGRLYRDGQGGWQLAYVGGQLKIDESDGETNEFLVPWPSDLVDTLDEYLRDWRPRFPQANTSPYVFLTEQGRQFSQGSVWSRFRMAVYQATRKRIWPHLLRHIWSDAYLDAHPGDYEGAAAMLNNSPDMVRARYRRFRREQHLQKAVDFNAAMFGKGT